MELYGDYVIMDKVHINGKEMVRGMNLGRGRQFATWEQDGDEYLWAHYFEDEIKAIEDLCRRSLWEIALIRDREIYRGATDGFSAVIKSGKDKVNIKFPTATLDDILKSIGIRESADMVCLNGRYSVVFDTATDKFTDALLHVVKDGDSLYQVNELAKAAYQSGQRAYGALEEKLKYGKYCSIVQILCDMEEYKEPCRADCLRNRER